MEKRLRITVDGREYQVTVEDLTESGNQLYPQPGSMHLPTPGAPPLGASPPAWPVRGAAADRPAAASGEIASTLSGVVESLPVTVGQQVAAGDKVAVIEAMKMKTPIIAQRAGQVTGIAVQVGQAVDAGQTLLTLAQTP